MLATLLALILAPRTTRAYFVGNSVTDALNYRAFAALFEARGRKLEWGRQVVPGAPMFWMWKVGGGFTEPPYGEAKQALGGYTWDVLTLEPFDRHERDLDKDGYDEGDVASARRYVAAAEARSPDLQVLVYARWPRMSVCGKAVAFDKNAYLGKGEKAPLPPGLDDWQALWNRPYTGGWDGTNETKAYFEHATAAIRAASPELRRPVRMIPVGHAMAALDLAMRAGQVPGHRSVWDVYNDGIHLDAGGSYLVGCAFYSAITGEDAHGLPAEPYGLRDPALARAVQDAVARTAKP